MNLAFRIALKQAVGAGGPLLLDIGKPNPWKEDDRQWFANNPNRSFRVRRIYVGEFPKSLLEGATHTIVRQVSPGLRDKRPVSGSGDELPDSECFCLVLWEAFDQGRTVGSNDAFRRAASMQISSVGGMQ